MSLYNYKKNQKIIKKIGLAGIISILVILLIIINFHQSSIYSTHIEKPSSISIKVTENFGSSILFDQAYVFESSKSAYSALNKIATVTTTFNGGYITSINGIQSQCSSENEQKKDWFYYINGMLASVGANIYKIHPGDTERWDYHDWSSNRLVTAIIGDYPEPFLHGYNGKTSPTIIVSNDSFYDIATNLQKTLEKYGIIVTIKSFEMLTDEEKKDHNLILIDTFENDIISDLNEDAENLGWFIEYEKGYISILNEKGETAQLFDQGGIICATQNIWNPKGNWHCENVIWLISGITHDDVVSAAQFLIDDSEEINHAVSVIIVDKTVSKVP